MMGRSIPPVSLQITWSGKEWVIHQRFELPSTLTGIICQKPHDAQQEEMQSPAAGEEKPHASVCMVNTWLESS